MFLCCCLPPSLSLKVSKFGQKSPKSFFLLNSHTFHAQNVNSCQWINVKWNSHNILHHAVHWLFQKSARHSFVTQRAYSSLLKQLPYTSRFSVPEQDLEAKFRTPQHVTKSRQKTKTNRSLKKIILARFSSRRLRNGIGNIQAHHRKLFYA